MKKKMRVFAAVLIAAALAVGMGTLAGATEAEEPGQEQTAAQTAPLEQAQKEKKSGLIESEGYFYYLEKGVLQTRVWKKIDGKRRYFRKSGKAAVSQVIKISGKYYYFNEQAVLGKAKKAYTVQTKKGWYFVNKNGTTAKKGWQKIGKKKYYALKTGMLKTGIAAVGKTYYYFSSKGVLKKAKKDRIVKIGGTDYLVLKTGKMGRGWCSIGKKYYYCKKNGRILKNTTKNGIKIGADGVAEKAPDAGKSALDKKAEAIAASITRSGMSQGEKIRACWNFVTSHANFYYSTAYYPGAYSQSEFRRLALLMLNGRAGNCYCFASAFAALTKACGCTSYVVYGLCPGSRDGRADGMTRHCWVYIAGHGYFDPEATYAGFASVYASGGNPWSEQGRVVI